MTKQKLREEVLQRYETVFGQPKARISFEAASSVAPLKLEKTLAPYQGSWQEPQIRHLLRRSLFGTKEAEVEAYRNLSLQECLAKLLREEPEPEPPLNAEPRDNSVPLGQTWVDAPPNPMLDGSRFLSLFRWWAGQMADQADTLREKMTLFWHNHFVTEAVVVGEPRIYYRYVALLRKHALGNFKTLTYEITVNSAMLIYLNGADSVAGSPNENYARELFELFTIGKGPQKGPGDYTTFTEEDVRAAARVLTGWGIDRRTRLLALYRSQAHDKQDKVFSAAFGNKIIKNAEENEYKLLIDMIFEKREVAYFLARKLYRFFVYYHIDSTIEDNVIKPLGDILYENNYEIKPALEALLGSEHFFDSQAMGCLIKNPADFVIGFVRQFEVKMPDANQLTKQYQSWDFLYGSMLITEMQLGFPPNVAGFAAYHQSPSYHRLWLNSVTMPFRKQFSDALLSSTGFVRNGVRLGIEPLEFAKKTSNPGYPDDVVADFAKILFPFQITQNQKAMLKEVLRPGIPDYEFTQQWNQYLENPSDKDAAEALSLKFRNLLLVMVSWAEYHLC
jgi:uncharacterized protein (DUF1800 family)